MTWMNELTSDDARKGFGAIDGVEDRQQCGIGFVMISDFLVAQDDFPFGVTSYNSV